MMDNILINGSCLDPRMAALPQVDLVFLDPPFNTGRIWDDYNDKKPLKKWLTFIREVVTVSHGLLKDTGTLWLNVDETYSHHVRVILDDVFGPANWVSTVVWRKHYRASVHRSIKTMHDPIFVYSRQPNWKRKRGFAPQPLQLSKYKNPNNDPNGPWRLKHNGDVTYLSSLMERGAMPTSWWDYTEAGHTEQAKKESDGFSTPKPELLMHQILTVGTDPGESVADLCAGSGTTLKVASDMGRSFIGVEESSNTIDSFIVPRLTTVPYVALDWYTPKPPTTEETD
jgi:adenine-specific DNA-methyltransferase